MSELVAKSLCASVSSLFAGAGKLLPVSDVSYLGVWGGLLNLQKFRGIGVKNKLYKHQKNFFKQQEHLIAYFLGSTPTRICLMLGLRTCNLAGTREGRKEGRREGRKEGGERGKKQDGRKEAKASMVIHSLIILQDFLLRLLGAFDI